MLHLGPPCKLIHKVMDLYPTPQKRLSRLSAETYAFHGKNKEPIWFQFTEVVLKGCQRVAIPPQKQAGQVLFASLL